MRIRYNKFYFIVYYFFHRYENEYFVDLGPPTQYPELEAAEKTLQALETLWQRCVER